MAAVYSVCERVRVVRLEDASCIVYNGEIGLVIEDKDYQSHGSYRVGVEQPNRANEAKVFGLLKLIPINLIEVMTCCRPGCKKISNKSLFCLFKRVLLQRGVSKE
jgi:hypothetical protein